MKVLLVRNDFLCTSGTIMVSAHKDDFDYLKANFEKVYDVLSEPLVVSPPEGSEVLPVEKNIEIESSPSLDWSRVNQPMGFWKGNNDMNVCQCNLYNKFGSLVGNSSVFGKPLRYTTLVKEDQYNTIYTVEEWERLVNDGCFGDDDGSGYWMKKGFKSNDEVFSTPRLDATHVIWYNK